MAAIPLVAGISRHAALNDFVAYDHRKITELRRGEAAAYGMNCDDPGFADISVFPRHFGEYEKDGVYFYLAEFLEGYKELNLFYKGGLDMMGEEQKILSLNGINQGEYPDNLDEHESSRILVNIAMQQVATALRCGLVFAPAFRAGDYVYSPKNDHAILHCLRHASGSSSGFWGLIHEDLKNTFDPQVELVTYQILQLLFWKESNLEFAGNTYPRGEFFIFSTFDLMRCAEGLLKKLPLTHAQWSLVIQLINYWREESSNFLADDDPEEIRRLQKRMLDVGMMGVRQG